MISPILLSTIETTIQPLTVTSVFLENIGY
uniref:Uncharacterized protein n=1 Tax=Heterorhabditis bacteriophora TaxID=37862 RepID=A0A1I7WHK2_HETBA